MNSMIKLPRSLTTVTLFSKTLAGIIFVALILTAFFVGMKYQAMTDFIKIQQSNPVITKLSPIPDPTANWKTYKNDEYGFEFKYPSKFSVQQFKGDKSFSLIYKSLSIWINTYNNEPSLNLQDYITKEYCKNGPLICKDLTKNKWVNEKRGMIDIWTYGFVPNLEGLERDTFLQNTQKLDTVVLVRFGSLKEGIIENENIYNQILSTFKFTNTPDKIACTMEAKLCPDGNTYVSRTGPNCEFAPCP